jgi:hypothetical protein
MLDSHDAPRIRRARPAGDEETEAIDRDTFGRERASVVAQTDDRQRRGWNRRHHAGQRRIEWTYELRRVRRRSGQHHGIRFDWPIVCDDREAAGTNRAQVGCMSRAFPEGSRRGIRSHPIAERGGEGPHEILHAASERGQGSDRRADGGRAPPCVPSGPLRSEQTAVFRFHLPYRGETGAQGKRVRVAGEDARDEGADQDLGRLAPDAARGEVVDALVAFRPRSRERFGHHPKLAHGREEAGIEECPRRCRHFVQPAAMEDEPTTGCVAASQQAIGQANLIDERERLWRAVEKSIRPVFAEIALDDLGANIAARSGASLEDHDIGLRRLTAKCVRHCESGYARPDDHDPRHASTPVGAPRKPVPSDLACASASWAPTCRSTSLASAWMNNGSVFKAGGR